MIEAGQMEPRVHHKSSPSSLLLNVSQNTPSCQSPAMEKSEVDLTRLCNINLTFKDNHYVSFHTLLDSGGFVENTSDDRRSIFNGNAHQILISNITLSSGAAALKLD